MKRLHIKTLTKLLVEFADSNDVVVSKAVRTDIHSDWFLGYFTIDEKWYNALTISSTLSEVTQRKLIMKCLQELGSQ